MRSPGRTGKPITFDPNRLGILDGLNLAVIQERAFPQGDPLPAHAAVKLALAVARAAIEAGGAGPVPAARADADHRHVDPEPPCPTSRT